jgi:hypothetical protein
MGALHFEQNAFMADLQFSLDDKTGTGRCEKIEK